MSKKNTGGEIASPSLWGKPLGRPGQKLTREQPEEKVTGMRTDEDDMDEEELDVDAELADADAHADEDVAEDITAEDDDSDAVAEAEEEEDAVEDDDDSEVDDDGLNYAPEAGDEAEEEQEDENVVSAVDDDEIDAEADVDEEIDEVSTESRTRKMSEKKKVSLSDHVRTEIDKRKNSGASLRGVDIVAALEKRGITVSAAQVSQLLKKAGLGGAPRGRKPAAAGVPADKPRAAGKAKKREEAAPAPKAKAGMTLKRREEPEAPRAAAKAPAKASNGFKVPLAQLQAAESFVDACGGSFKDAERILTAAANLSQTFGR